MFLWTWFSTVFILLFSSLVSVTLSSLCYHRCNQHMALSLCNRKRHFLSCVHSGCNYYFFIICISLIQESCSLRPRSTSCWFTTLMPSSTIRNIVMRPANTVWHCNRRRCSAKHLKFVPRLVELHLTSRHRFVRYTVFSFRLTRI